MCLMLRGDEMLHVAEIAEILRRARTNHRSPCTACLHCLPACLACLPACLPQAQIDGLRWPCHGDGPRHPPPPLFTPAVPDPYSSACRAAGLPGQRAYPPCFACVNRSPSSHSQPPIRKRPQRDPPSHALSLHPKLHLAPHRPISTIYPSLDPTVRPNSQHHNRPSAGSLFFTKHLHAAVIRHAFASRNATRVSRHSLQQRFLYRERKRARCARNQPALAISRRSLEP